MNKEQIEQLNALFEEEEKLNKDYLASVIEEIDKVIKELKK